MTPQDLFKLVAETDKLKSVYRRTYLTDDSRNENSAEHSWHLSVALLALRPLMPPDVDFHRALEIALLHDICEIGAGDISVFDSRRSEKTVEEAAYMQHFREEFGEFGQSALSSWLEYEDQASLESRWVKVVDRLLPFCINMMTDGKAWKEQGISREQVLKINQPTAALYPGLYAWLQNEIDRAVANGWLLDS